MKTLNLIRRLCKECLTPPPELTVSQWAERYRILDNSSAFPGRWSNSVTPYLVGIMDEYCNPYTREIIFCKPTQVGGTEALLNMIGWTIMQDASPTMIVFPTDKLAESASDNRLQIMFGKCPEIKAIHQTRKSKRLEQKFAGMTLYLTGANSPSTLASRAIRNLFLDETDKYPGASKAEASPIKLAKERTKTYPLNKKIYDNCTPTLKTGHIWEAKETADVERHYFVPCPHCGEYIELLFKQIIFPSGDDGLTNAERAEQALYFCQECGGAIEDLHKPGMLRRGEWREVARRIGVKQIPRTVAFWLNTLYSPFVTWADIAREFLDSKDDPESLQNFVNSWLAEPWENTKSRMDEDLVMERQTEYEEFVVPDWVRLLVAGVDVQETSVYWTIRAWGPHMTSQNIAHGQALSLNDLDEIMNRYYERRDGVKLQVALCAIDSGDQTAEVYDFCGMRPEWTVPVKGASKPLIGNFRISTVDKPNSRAHGQRLALVDGGKYKSQIAWRLRKEPGQGSWLVFKGCDLEYAKQITAEQLVTEKDGSERWVPKTSHAANHYLDAEVYCFLAADLCNVRTLYLQEQPPKALDPPVREETQDAWIPSGDKWI